MERYTGNTVIDYMLYIVEMFIENYVVFRILLKGCKGYLWTWRKTNLGVFCFMAICKPWHLVLESCPELVSNIWSGDLKMLKQIYLKMKKGTGLILWACCSFYKVSMFLCCFSKSRSPDPEILLNTVITKNLLLHSCLWEGESKCFSLLQSAEMWVTLIKVRITPNYYFECVNHSTE